jgi:putative transposase
MSPDQFPEIQLAVQKLTPPYDRWTMRYARLPFMIRPFAFLSANPEHRVPLLLSPSAVWSLVDAIAIVLAQAYQLARIRLASTASPVMRLLCQRDHAHSTLELLKRELSILRSQRESVPPHRRPDYLPEQRLAILQLKRLRGWGVRKTARRFVLHPNTIRCWIKAVEGRGNDRLFEGAIVWNRIDDAVRWAAHELRRLCPEPEFGARSIARHLVRAGMAISRSTVQRVLRESPPTRPSRPPRAAMAAPAGIPPRHLLRPNHINHVWHVDMISLHVLWLRFTAADILDGFSRRILRFKLYAKMPRQRDLARLVQGTIRESGKPRFLITDHGTQFRRGFQSAMGKLDIGHVKGRVRAPYLNGKIERAFRTFRLWWSVILCGATRRGLQCRLDNYRYWYNHHRPHSALHGITPDEAWHGTGLSEPFSFRHRDHVKPRIGIRRLYCRGDPLLPVIHITVQRAA